MKKWTEWRDFARNEANLENHHERGLLKAEYVKDHLLRLWFEEELAVSIYELDFYPLFIEEDPGEIFLALRKKDRFRLVRGDYALVWLNPETGNYDEKAIDVAPECIRFFCERYGTKLKTRDLRRCALLNLAYQSAHNKHSVIRV